MLLQNVCSFTDSYYIAEYRSELNQDFYASSEMIYTDGTYDHEITCDGYIHIKNLYNADYILFLDKSSELFLGVYKHIHEVKFKEIVYGINTLRKEMQDLQGSEDEKTKEEKEEERSELEITNSNMVDINNMVCTECHKSDFKEPFTYIPDTGELICECNVCHTIFTLIPSKYYLIKNKSIPIENIYDTISRNIVNKSNNKTVVTTASIIKKKKEQENGKSEVKNPN